MPRSGGRSFAAGYVSSETASLHPPFAHDRFRTDLLESLGNSHSSRCLMACNCWHAVTSDDEGGKIMAARIWYIPSNAPFGAIDCEI